MDNQEAQFLQNALRKHTNNEHMTVYEKARVGRHFSQDLTKDRFNTLKEIAEERYPKELEKVDDFRTHGFEKLKNDRRMENPLI